MAILAIIILIITFLIDVNRYIFIALFAIDFFIVGLAATTIIYPNLSLKQIIHKPIQMVIFGIIFTIIDTVITIQFLNVNQTQLLIVFGIIILALIIISIFIHRSKENTSLGETTKTIQKLTEDTNTDKPVEKSINRLIYVLVILSIITLTSILLKPFNIIPIWEALSLPFIILIPGYLIINSIIPGEDELSILERIGIAVFISLIISSLIGFIQAQIMGSLQMSMMTIIVIALTLIIFIPRYVLKTRNTSVEKVYVNSRIDKLLLIITIIGVIAVLGTGIYASSVGMTSNENITMEFNGITDAPAKDGYYNYNSGDEVSFELKINNNEAKDINGKIEATINNETANKKILEQKHTLKGKSSVVVPINLTMATGRKDIRFTLYDEQNKPIKIKHLFLNVTESSDYDYEYSYEE